MDMENFPRLDLSFHDEVIKKLYQFIEEQKKELEDAGTYDENNNGLTANISNIKSLITPHSSVTNSSALEKTKFPLKSTIDPMNISSLTNSGNNKPQPQVTYLLPPQRKIQLISPPPSPPDDWVSRPEDGPNKIAYSKNEYFPKKEGERTILLDGTKKTPSITVLEPKKKHFLASSNSQTSLKNNNSNDNENNENNNNNNNNNPTISIAVPSIVIIDPK